MQPLEQGEQAPFGVGAPRLARRRIEAIADVVVTRDLRDLEKLYTVFRPLVCCMAVWCARKPKTGAPFSVDNPAGSPLFHGPRT